MSKSVPFLPGWVAQIADNGAPAIRYVSRTPHLRPMMYSIAHVPDGRATAVDADTDSGTAFFGGPGWVGSWNQRTRRWLYTLDKYDTVSAIKVSHSGVLIAVTTLRGAVVIMRAEDGGLVQYCPAIRGSAVRTCAFSHDDHIVYAGCETSAIKVFSVTLARVQRADITFPFRSLGAVTCMSTAHSARVGDVLAVCYANGHLLLWEAAASRLLARLCVGFKDFSTATAVYVCSGDPASSAVVVGSSTGRVVVMSGFDANWEPALRKSYHLGAVTGRIDFITEVDGGFEGEVSVGGTTGVEIVPLQMPMVAPKRVPATIPTDAEVMDCTHHQVATVLATRGVSSFARLPVELVVSILNMAGPNAVADAALTTAAGRDVWMASGGRYMAAAFHKCAGTLVWWPHASTEDMRVHSPGILRRCDRATRRWLAKNHTRVGKVLPDLAARFTSLGADAMATRLASMIIDKGDDHTISFLMEKLAVDPRSVPVLDCLWRGNRLQSVTDLVHAACIAANTSVIEWVATRGIAPLSNPEADIHQDELAMAAGRQDATTVSAILKHTPEDSLRPLVEYAAVMHIYATQTFPDRPPAAVHGLDTASAMRCSAILSAIACAGAAHQPGHAFAHRVVAATEINPTTGDFWIATASTHPVQAHANLTMHGHVPL